MCQIEELLPEPKLNVLFDDRSLYRMRAVGAEDLGAGVSAEHLAHLLTQAQENKPAVLSIRIGVCIEDGMRVFCDEHGAFLAEAFVGTTPMPRFECSCETARRAPVLLAVARETSGARLQELGWIAASMSLPTDATVFERSWYSSSVGTIALGLAFALTNAYGVTRQEELDTEVLPLEVTFDPVWFGTPLSKAEAFRLASEAS